MKLHSFLLLLICMHCIVHTSYGMDNELTFDDDDCEFFISQPESAVTTMRQRPNTQSPPALSPQPAPRGCYTFLTCLALFLDVDTIALIKPKKGLPLRDKHLHEAKQSTPLLQRKDNSTS